MLLDAHESQLVLVDFQTRLIPALLEGQQVLANALRLARAAQVLQVPALATEQYPQGLGATDPDLKAVLDSSGGRLLGKLKFSAAADGLVESLRPGPVRSAALGNARSLPKHLQKVVPAPIPRNSVVLAGCEAHVCLLQTALELLDDEFDVWVVTDACSSRTERNRDAAFDRLAGAGVELVTTEMVIFEWLRGADHPHFKEIQGLIK